LEEVNELMFDHEWIPVYSAAGEHYSYPVKPSVFLKKTYDKPVVYRWVIVQNRTTVAMYLGEAQSLHSRIDAYRRGHVTQQTNARLKSYFTSLDEARTVRLEILKFEQFKLFERFISQADLEYKHVRCFFENLFITVCPANVELLNITPSRVVKQASRALKMPPEQVRKLLNLR
jgi:hypothetical protein